MKNKVLLSIIGISFTILVGGVALLFNESITSRTIGIVLVAVSVFLPSLALIYYKISEMQYKGIQSTENASSQIKEYSNKLEELVNKIGIANDARFVLEGFIGLQRQTIVIESNPEVGSNYVRMAVLGHLPSYMRLNPISDERGRRLYHNWEPPHYIPEYVKLINQRREAFNSFIEKGGVVREIYKKSAIIDYVKKGFTFHDKILDPKEEIEQRLRALLFYLDKQNYFLCFLEEELSGPNYLLKSNIGLVVDLRTPETDRHFTHSVEGLFTESKAILKEFERKFAIIWKTSDRLGNKEFIENLLLELKNSKEPK